MKAFRFKPLWCAFIALGGVLLYQTYLQEAYLPWFLSIMVTAIGMRLAIKDDD